MYKHSSPLHGYVNSSGIISQPTRIRLYRVFLCCCTFLDGNAGELVSPPKPYDQVQSEANAAHDMYVYSHKDYHPAEQVHRKYPSDHYSIHTQFGRPTPHDNAGSMTYKSLKWVHELQSEKASKIVNKRLDDWREKFQDQLGQTRDP